MRVEPNVTAGLSFHQAGVLIQYATEIKVRAERKCGDLLAAVEKNTGIRVSGGVVVERCDRHQTPTLADMGTTRDGEGRYCLNDLHRASGEEQRHRPKYWLANSQTKALANEIAKGGFPPIDAKQGIGTYVAKELVYAYAMWISPTFALKVIRTYDAFMEAALRGAPKGNQNAAKDDKTNATNSSQLISVDLTPKKRAPETRKKLAAKAGVSEHKAQQALHVARKASPAVNAAVRAGEMSLKDAVKTVAPVKPKPKPIR